MLAAACVHPHRLPPPGAFRRRGGGAVDLVRRLSPAASAAAALAAAGPAAAHDVAEQARLAMLNGSLLDVAWIGAEHMLTGYDHLLFLLGVIFFLSSLKQIVTFITAFTVGHTITLLFATLAGITANPYLIDAVIALTVCYKAFENLGGFRRWLGASAPDLLLMVFAFGLIHGFGLSTRLQQMTLVDDPQLIPKILAFNVGVEAGQIAALLVMSLAVNAWRQTVAWPVIVRSGNAALMAAGALLFVQQVAGFLGGLPAAPGPDGRGAVVASR
jgi:hypothetical protein